MSDRNWSETALSFKNGLRADAMFGGWLEAGTPVLVDALAAAGAQWIAVDLQHGLEMRTCLSECIRAADAWGLATVVRIPHASPDHVAFALDSGASAIIVPLVEDAETAANIVAWSRFAPIGRRSWGPLGTLVRSPELTPEVINSAISIFVMIESETGYKNREEILSTPGVDGVFVGPTDLSISALGELPRWPLDARVERMVEDILDTAARKALVPGYSCGDGEIAVRRSEQGFRLLSLASDLSLVKAGWADHFGQAKGGPSTPIGIIGQYGT